MGSINKVSKLNAQVIDVKTIFETIILKICVNTFR